MALFPLIYDLDVSSDSMFDLDSIAFIIILMSSKLKDLRGIVTNRKYYKWSADKHVNVISDIS